MASAFPTRPVCQPPHLLGHEQPAGETEAAFFGPARSRTREVPRGKDDRLLVIAGPCAIHDPLSVMEYAGSHGICSVMQERHRITGRQDIADGINRLAYRQGVTYACDLRLDPVRFHAPFGHGRKTLSL